MNNNRRLLLCRITRLLLRWVGIPEEDAVENYDEGVGEDDDDDENAGEDDGEDDDEGDDAGD